MNKIKTTFQPLSDEIKKQVAAKCQDTQFALNYLRTLDSSLGYETNIKYLMVKHQVGIINDDDMAKLCKAVRYLFGIVPNLILTK